MIETERSTYSRVRAFFYPSIACIRYYFHVFGRHSYLYLILLFIFERLDTERLWTSAANWSRETPAIMTSEIFGTDRVPVSARYHCTLFFYRRVFLRRYLVRSRNNTCFNVITMRIRCFSKLHPRRISYNIIIICCIIIICSGVRSVIVL